MSGLEAWLATGTGGTPSQAPAWYGKLPALGDFAHRRGNEQFNALLDAWLQRAMTASRAQLQGDWTHAYLGAPLWSFAFFPGVVGDAPYAGVLMSSVDRVGRYFPLTVYTQVPYARGLLRELQTGTPWYAYVQQALPQVLDTRFTQEQFEALLAAAPPPPGLAQALDDGSVNVAWAEVFQQGRPLTVPGPGTAIDALARDLTTHYLRGATLWWAPLPSGATLVRAFQGMPAPEAYAGMLTAGT
ncbi:type VI secretion system-associated protein TagF [Caldimonas thermodepolymerans]|uniref:type VI secretion system-associated protein TagF n=1 Tax=Caldimonas thermodepolymerans TaxID=215580 RepID=UPI002235A730|nr:type VI secretion system-associated protein TagF [Caldimonas thermodepolymerans]UZG45882.1 type VI secretion system-associated protein TagF [Caldimonas thermodepolymerans]